MYGWIAYVMEIEDRNFMTKWQFKLWLSVLKQIKRRLQASVKII